jgi:hypothetical protein
MYNYVYAPILHDFHTLIPILRHVQEVSVEPEEVPWLLQGAVAESDGMARCPGGARCHFLRIAG